MHVLIFLLCCLFIILVLNVDKRIYNPLVLFNICWGITIFISGFGFYNMFIPSNETYFIMLIGIVFFNISGIFYYMFNDKFKIKNIVPKIVNPNQYEQVNKFLLVLQTFVLVELLRRSIVVIGLLNSGMPYTMIRYAYFYEDKIMPGYLSLINSWFVSPIITVSTIIVALQFFNKNYNKKLLFSTLVLIGLTSFSSGSRNILVSTGVILVLSFFLSGLKTRISFNRKFKLVSMLILFIIFFFYVTSARTEGENVIDETLNHVVTYYTGPFIYFELLCDYAMENRVILYGLTFFGGIVDIIITFLNSLGLSIKMISSYIGEYNQTVLNIGSGEFNALPTMLYTFMFDLGILGIMIGPFLFGTFSNYIYYKMLSVNNIMYKGMYIMVGKIIYESIMRWDGVFVSTWMVFLFLIVYEFMSRKRVVIR